MIAIPALHDAASDQPVRYTPVCSRTPIPVCVHPAYAGYLPAVTAAVGPVLTEFAGLPGAPARISQVAAIYRAGARQRHHRHRRPTGASGFVAPRPAAGPARRDRCTEFAAQPGPGLRAAARRATSSWAAAAGRPPQQPEPGRSSRSSRARSGSRRPSRPATWRRCTGQPAAAARQPGRLAAAQRFAALSPAARHAWLAAHLAALRAAASRWRSCHDGGRGAPGAPARRRAAAFRPPWSCWRPAPPGCGARCTGTGTTTARCSCR